MDYAYYHSNYGMIIEKQKVNTTKEINYLGESITLVYAYTHNDSDVLPSKSEDPYTAIDVYKDVNGTEYMFLYNSDTLCGYRPEGVYGDAVPQEEAVSEEEARNAAEEYIVKVIPNFEDYQFISAAYSEQDAVYLIMYCTYIENMKTDDTITIWVKYTGEVKMFAAHNLNRYEQCYDKTYNIDEIYNDFLSSMNSSMELLGVCITTYDGKIGLAFFVLIDNGNYCYATTIGRVLEERFIYE